MWKPLSILTFVFAISCADESAHVTSNSLNSVSKNFTTYTAGLKGEDALNFYRLLNVDAQPLRAGFSKSLEAGTLSIGCRVPDGDIGGAPICSFGFQVTEDWRNSVIQTRADLTMIIGTPEHARLLYDALKPESQRFESADGKFNLDCSKTRCLIVVRYI